MRISDWSSDVCSSDLLKLVGAATVVEPDGSGRLLLPASHRNAAGIEKKAVLLGMGGKFELWSEQAHLAQLRQTIGEDEIDRKSVVEGKRLAVRGELGGSRSITKKTQNKKNEKR